MNQPEHENEFVDRNEMQEKVSYRLTAMYAYLMQFAHSNKQTTGEKNDYYVTLEQLEGALKSTNLL
jgi:hypothetical protein